MMDQHQKEVNEFPLMFAFSKDQFNKGMKEKFNLKETDTDQIVSIGMGGFCKKSDVESFKQMLVRQDTEFAEAISSDETGENFIYQMFLYELSNHEYGYTGEVEDTLNALGMTLEYVNNKNNVKNGLKLAIKEIRENE